MCRINAFCSESTYLAIEPGGRMLKKQNPTNLNEGMFHLTKNDRILHEDDEILQKIYVS